MSELEFTDLEDLLILQIHKFYKICMSSVNIGPVQPLVYYAFGSSPSLCPTLTTVQTTYPKIQLIHHKLLNIYDQYWNIFLGANVSAYFIRSTFYELSGTFSLFMKVWQRGKFNSNRKKVGIGKVMKWPRCSVTRCWNKKFQIGREPWSSGCGRRLVFRRSLVRILALYIGWTFFHIYLS